MNPKDINFAYRVRHALNEKLDDLPGDTTDRLALARKMALSRKKKENPLTVAAARRALAGQGTLSEGGSPRAWFLRASLVIPLLVVAAGLAGLYYLEDEQRVQDTADIDAAVLSDELPIDAYLDQGFHAYITKKAE